MIEKDIVQTNQRYSLYFESWKIAQEWLKEKELEFKKMLKTYPDVERVHFLDITIGDERLIIKKASDLQHMNYPAGRKGSYFIYFKDLK